MDTYTLMRHFADSWMMLALFLFFIGVILWAFRPGSRKAHDDSAQIPLRNDRHPIPDSNAGTGGKHTTEGA